MQLSLMMQINQLACELTSDHLVLDLAVLYVVHNLYVPNLYVPNSHRLRINRLVGTFRPMRAER